MASQRNGSNGNGKIDSHLRLALGKLTAPDNVATFFNHLGKKLFLMVVDLKTKTFSVIDIKREGMAKFPKECLAGQMIFFLESAAQVDSVVKTALPGFTEDPMWHKG